MLLATPFASQTHQDRRAQDEWREGKRRFKASDFQLRKSDVAFVMDAAGSCNFSPDVLQLLRKWKTEGSWQSPQQLIIGAARLSKPKGLRNMGDLQTREEFVLWHAWGRPLPHTESPQFLLFKVLDAVCFKEPLDFQVYITRLRLAEQRTSWVVHLPDVQVLSLLQSVCTNGHSFLPVLESWGMPTDARSHVVFSSLGPLVHLVAHRKWRVLADMARCTTQLLAKPKGESLQKDKIFPDLLICQPSLL